ncbi:hypothetical protein ABT160_05265 [Streptomyces sp. NPDC001941]
MTIVHAADGIPVRRARRLLLCADRCVDLLRVNSALCTGRSRTLDLA